MGATPQHPRYRFDRWLAAGGMGEVWHATDLLLEREVAVKVLRRELGQDPVVRARFAAEARHAGSLQHPNVASVLDYGELDAEGQPPLPFLVMELVDGQSLSALLAGGPLEPAVTARLLAQAADGLEAAHQLGIVHRDVKPGNLLVTGSGQVKVTDFGVARAADAASLTLTGHLVGTPHYLAPEQAEGACATAVSDVYALGIVLYECLTGRKPFSGESPVSTALMQIREPLPPFPADVPERLQHIARIATAKAPADRFRSAGAMAAALRDESPETRTFLLAPSVDAPAAPQPPRTRAGRRRRPVLAGLAALALAAGGVWALTAADTGPRRAPAEAVADIQRLGTAVVLTPRGDPSPTPSGTAEGSRTRTQRAPGGEGKAEPQRTGDPGGGAPPTRTPGKAHGKHGKGAEKAGTGPGKSAGKSAGKSGPKRKGSTKSTGSSNGKGGGPKGGKG